LLIAGESFHGYPCADVLGTAWNRNVKWGYPSFVNAYADPATAVRARGVDSRNHPGPGLEGLVSKLREVLRGRVLLAYLFGGRAEGHALKGDYDIAVLMPEGYTLFDLGALQVDVARALGVDEELVDIVCLNSAPPELVVEALSGVPIVEDPVARLGVEVKALRELLDMRESMKLVNRELHAC